MLLSWDPRVTECIWTGISRATSPNKNMGPGEHSLFPRSLRGGYATPVVDNMPFTWHRMSCTLTGKSLRVHIEPTKCILYALTDDQNVLEVAASNSNFKRGHTLRTRETWDGSMAADATTLKKPLWRLTGDAKCLDVSSCTVRIDRRR